MSISSGIEIFNPNPKTAQEAIEQCVMANRILANENIVDVYGNLSVRNPQDSHAFFQAARIPPELVTRNDMMEIDLNGNVISQYKGPCIREIALHASIYRARPDVNAICHCHSQELEPFACTGTPIRPLAHPMGIFHDGVPIFIGEELSSGLLFTSDEHCQPLTQALGACRALLMRHRGAVIVGENVINMINASVSLRDCALMQLRAVSLGEPVYMTEDESREMCALTLSSETGERMWRHWVQRVKKDMPDLYW